MKLLIKNMVSLRCKMIVESELKALGIPVYGLTLGEVETSDDLSFEKIMEIDLALRKFGLELLEDKKASLIEKIKIIVIEMIHLSEEPPTLNFSSYLSEKMNYEYNYLSNLFSEVNGITIEHYIIKHKIERVKELLFYNELSLTEIADKLHYCHVAHLSNQFKKITGLTPTLYKKLRNKDLRVLDNL